MIRMTKSGYREIFVASKSKKQSKNGFKYLISNSIFAFIFCPILAYKIIINFLPIILSYSLILSSVLFSFALLVLCIPFIKTFSVFRKFTGYIIQVFFNTNALLRVNNFRR